MRRKHACAEVRLANEYMNRASSEAMSGYHPFGVEVALLRSYLVVSAENDFETKAFGFLREIKTSVETCMCRRVRVCALRSIETIV